MKEFARLKRLPPYVFTTVNKIKMDARRAGEDIIDLGMGNPDQATPSHIVEKMIEAARKGKNHRYSASRGITKLRHAICSWYKRNYDVELDPETEAIVTIGSKEGLAHLALAMIGPGDVVLTPTPTYPIHMYSFIIAGGEVRGIELRQDSVKWYADIAYQAELGRIENLKASQDISSTEERLRIPGSKNIETVLGDIFTTIINRLDLNKLFAAAHV